MSDIDVGDASDDRDLEGFNAVSSEAFGEKVADSRRWMTAAKDHMRVRVARAGTTVVGGYALAPIGQFFGGRSVPAQGVMAVVVSPAWRRRGIAGALMKDLVGVASEQGSALAPLNAATTRLYRRWGWEVGDRSLTQTVRTEALGHFRGEGRAARDPERAQVEILRRSYLKAWDGPLDRPDWWLSVEWDAGDPTERRFEYGWWEGDALTGYLRYNQLHGGAGGTGWIVTRVHEFIATTRDAQHGLMGFLGGLEAQCMDVAFRHGALPVRSPLLYLVPDVDKQVEIEGFLCWMQRIVDVGAAFHARGWPPAATARVELEISDPVTGVQRGVLEVSGGAGQLTPGGDGGVKCGIGVLSAWYSSTLRARDAARLGLLTGPSDAIAALDTLTGDRDPWLPDFF